MFHINNMTQMSCNFREQSKIVRTGEKMSQTKPHPKRPTPACGLKWRVFSAGFPRGDTRSAKIIRRFDPPFKMAKSRGEGGVICGLISLKNGLIDSRQMLYEDGQCHLLHFIFRQDLSNLYG